VTQRGHIGSWSHTLSLALLSCLALAVILPFWVMLTGSVSPTELLSSGRLPLFPTHVTGEHYQHAWQQVPMLQYTWNSLWVSFLASSGQVFVSAMAAFGFAKLRFPGRDSLFFAVLLTMMVPPQVNLVPLFLVMKSLHWVNTLWALIIPGCFGAFGIFLLRQWFLTIPSELDDAARLDGASTWQFYWRVALPMVLPALATLGIYSFIVNWNSFMWPLVIIQSDALRTLPLGLAELKNTYRDAIDWGVMMAACTISVMPIVLLYVATQKQLTRNLVQGAVKG
jgi:multiple sugar transport system permease protein